MVDLGHNWIAYCDDCDWESKSNFMRRKDAKLSAKRHLKKPQFAGHECILQRFDYTEKVG